MENQFKLMTITRQNILKAIEDLTLEQVNLIPKNFNNSIGWQVVHIIVTQQLLHYKLSGNSMLISDDLIENYRKGSSGKQELNKENWKVIKSLFLSLPQKLFTDYEDEVFEEYTTYATSYNATLNNIEEAIAFNNLHEAMHLGTINAMKKLL